MEDFITEIINPAHDYSFKKIEIGDKSWSMLVEDGRCDPLNIDT